MPRPSPVNHPKTEPPQTVPSTRLHYTAVPSVARGMCSNPAFRCRCSSVSSPLRLDSSCDQHCCYRYNLSGAELSDEQRVQFAAMVHDRMTEEVYLEPLSSFQVCSHKLDICRLKSVNRHGATTACHSAVPSCAQESDSDSRLAVFVCILRSATARLASQDNHALPSLAFPFTGLATHDPALLTQDLRVLHA